MHEVNLHVSSAGSMVAPLFEFYEVFRKGRGYRRHGLSCEFYSSDQNENLFLSRNLGTFSQQRYQVGTKRRSS
jgi:hypothetical protein